MFFLYAQERRANFINRVERIFLIQFEEKLFPFNFNPRFLTIIILVIVNDNDKKNKPRRSLFYLLPSNLMGNR